MKIDFYLVRSPGEIEHNRMELERIPSRGDIVIFDKDGEEWEVERVIWDYAENKVIVNCKGC